MMKISDIIIPKFYSAHYHVQNNTYTHFYLPGGRSSTKSSFVAIEIIYNMMRDYNNNEFSNAVVLRKVTATCKDSVYANLLWAIDVLNVKEYWDAKLSPLSLIYKPSGQQILFRGSANKRDYEKIKSIKFIKGYCKYAWFEELSEFDSLEEIRQINASLLRGEGNDNAKVFYTYNPPASKNAWVNKYRRDNIKSRIVVDSTYLDVPASWLGKTNLNDINELKEININKYNYMYLAQEIGEGLEIYKNVIISTISNDQINSFKKISRGLDLGFKKDASSYVETYYDENKQNLYIFNEVYGWSLSNQALYDKIKPLSQQYLIKCDCAEPRTINELNKLGLNVRACRKGKDSLRHGIRWLQNLNAIYIDKQRCPYAASDFELYEYEKNAYDNIKDGDYPHETHASAATRYALDDIILDRTVKAVNIYR